MREGFRLENSRDALDSRILEFWFIFRSPPPREAEGNRIAGPVAAWQDQIALYIFEFEPGLCDGVENDNKVKGLILAQNERWRRG